MTEIQINSRNNNQISFEEVYHEKVLLRHFQGLYSNFDLTITPNSENTIKLKSDDSTAQQFLNHIEKGIKQFIKVYSENDISINGFDIITENDKFHPLDSKPLAYQIPIIEAIKRIIRNPKTIRKIIKPKLICNQYHFETHENLRQYQNLQWDSLRTDQLIRTHAQTKSLIINGIIKISNFDTNITLESNLTEYNTRAKNRIELRFKKNQYNIEEMINYLNIVKLIILDEYRVNLNPSGFILYFEKNNTKTEWRIEDTNLTFEWCLRNILNSKNTYIVKEEADR